MDLRNQLALIRHWAWLLLACAVGTGLFTFAIYSRLPKTYEASATVIVGEPLKRVNPSYSNVLVWKQLALIYSRIVTTDSILEVAATAAGSSVAAADLRDRVHAVTPADTTLIRITAQDDDPDRAARIATAAANQLGAVGPGGLIKVIDPATAPNTAAEPRVLVDATLAGGVGLLAATAFVFGVHGRHFRRAAQWS